jgi:hypothetical protein
MDGCELVGEETKPRLDEADGASDDGKAMGANNKIKKSLLLRCCLDRAGRLVCALTSIEVVLVD